MIVSFDPIPGLSFKNVQFISAKLGKDSLSEFEKFDKKEFAKPQHITERQIIYQTIEKVGERGAKTFYFRPEGPAFALPGDDFIRVTRYGIEMDKGFQIEI